MAAFKAETRKGKYSEPEPPVMPESEKMFNGQIYNNLAAR